MMKAQEHSNITDIDIIALSAFAMITRQDGRNWIKVQASMDNLSKCNIIML